MASVTPRKLASGDISWRVQAKVGNSMRGRSFAVEKGAREFANLVERVGWEAADKVLQARRNNTTKCPTLRDFTEQYLDRDTAMLTGITDATRASYVAIANRTFLPVMGDMPIDAITRDTVAKWVDDLLTTPRAIGQAPLAPKTARNFHALLSNIFRDAVARGYRPDNPAQRIKIQSARQVQPVFLTMDEVRALINNAHPHYQLFIEFLFGTGLRWGEATALKWKYVNFDGNPPTVRVEEAWKKSTGTGGSELGLPKTSRSRRTVSLYPSLAARLYELKGAPDELVFKGLQGKGRIHHGRFTKSVWEPAIKAAGIERKPRVHDLRHGHASAMLADGLPIHLVQARLGHESITTTVATYGHLQPDAHKIMADAWASRMATVYPTSQRAVGSAPSSSSPEQSAKPLTE